MSFTDPERDTYGMYKKLSAKGPGAMLVGAKTLFGEEVYGMRNDYLGDIKEIMLEMATGKVAYAVLSFGGFIGLSDKLFVVPWMALKLDAINQHFMLNVEKESLKNAPGFDKDDWPDMTDQSWVDQINAYYSVCGVVPDSTMH